MVEVERLPVNEGGTIEIDKVLLIADGDDVVVGTPVVSGAKVVATVLGEAKGKKVIAFKYKQKVRYRRKIGHRQVHTRLAIEQIIPGNDGGS
jgi:large subunit ribosomal protein L21